ncbi:N-acetyl-beta-D-galactosaminidase [Aureococcus anophagefferens]|nr:N-acetyl-beta-D-galactosaminidase [Aureococcus anophagefferens]
MRPATAEATVHTREPRSPEAVDDLLARARAAVADRNRPRSSARRRVAARSEPSLAGYGNGGYFDGRAPRAGDDGRPEEPPSPPKSRENSPVGRLYARRRRRHRRRPKSAPSSVSDHLLKTTASSSVKNVGRRESRHRHAVNNWFSASHAYKADAPKLDKRTRSETIRDGDGRGFLQTTTESAGRDVHSRERMESMITRENANWFSPSSKTKAVAAHGDAPPSPDRSPESRSRPRSAPAGARSPPTTTRAGASPGRPPPPRGRVAAARGARDDDDARARPQTQKFGRSSPFARAPRPSRLDPSYDGPWRLGEIGWFRIPEDKKAPKDAEPRFLRVRVSSVHLRDRDSGGGIGSLTLAALRGGKVDIPREYLRGNQSAIASEILRRGGRISEVLRVTAEAYERREQRANAAKTMQRNLRILCGVPKKGDRMTLGDAILRYRLHVRHDVSHTIEEEDEEEEASAATRMQAIMRARRDREAVKGRHAAAAKLQRLQRKRSFRRKRRGSEFRRDAELRGRGADFVSHDRDDALYLDSPFPNQETAARALQARLRGDRARKDRRREHAGASRLQARVRGRRSRAAASRTRILRDFAPGPASRFADADAAARHRRELAALDAADEDARARAEREREFQDARVRSLQARVARLRGGARKHARRSVVEQRQALAEALMDVEGSRRQAEEALAAERAAAAAARDEQNRDHAAKVLFYEEELKAAAWRAAQQRELEATVSAEAARDAAPPRAGEVADARAARTPRARRRRRRRRPRGATSTPPRRSARRADLESARAGRAEAARAAALEDAAKAAVARADAEARAAALEEAREAAVARERAPLAPRQRAAAEADEARAEAGAERAKREALEAEKDALEAARRDAARREAPAPLKAAAASPDPRRERPPAEAPVPAVAAATPLPRDRGAFETPYAEPPSANSAAYTPAFEPEGTPAAGPAPAPDDWEELFDDAEGRAYYWSKARDESRWDKPACLVTLYSDWEKHFDAASQHYYYYSESRGESTWDAPEPTRRPGGATPTPRKWTPAKSARPTPSRRLP